jgi:alpha-mannosidase
VGWCADSFGMNAQVPQIYKKSGYKWVAFRRGAKEIQSEFLWRALDGTTILAHWMPLGYRAGFYLDKLEESYIELNKYATTSHILMPSGSGSTPPQKETVDVVRKWNEDHRGESRMKIATPSEFFQVLEGEEGNFKIHEGELYDEDLVDVFPQVCSSRAWVVMGARKCEGLLITAEWFSTLAWLLGKEYPGTELNECWEKMLFIAFHDIIAGCGVDEIYDEVREIFSFLEEHLSRILYDDLKFIASRVDTQGEAVIVFNPLSWGMSNWCEVDLGACGLGQRAWTQTWRGGDRKPGFRDEKGRGRKNQAGKLGFRADLPPLGYKVYRVIESRLREIRNRKELSKSGKMK